MHLQENTVFDLWPWLKLLPSTLYIICKVWSCYIQRIRRYIYKKIRCLTFDMKCCPVPSKSCDLCSCKVWRPKSHEMLPNNHYNMWLMQPQSLKPLRQTITGFRRCIYKEIHYLTFDLGIMITWNVAKYPLHHLTYAAAKFEAATSNDLGGDAYTRKYIILPLIMGSRSHEMKLQYPLHHVTYSGSKFEIYVIVKYVGADFLRKQAQIPELRKILKTNTHFPSSILLSGIQTLYSAA